MLFMVTLMVFSCNKDETGSDSIIGEWEFFDVEYNGVIDDGWDVFDFEGDVFDIQGGVIFEENNEYSGDSEFSVRLVLNNGSINDTLTNVPFYLGYSGTWSINNNEITLVDYEGDETDTYTFNISNDGNTLSITGADWRSTSDSSVFVDNAVYIYHR